MGTKKAAEAATGDAAKVAKEREYMTFYRSFFDAINLCEDRDIRLTMYESILHYAFNKTEPDFRGNTVLQYFWIGVRPILQKSREKFEIGCLGGAPEGNTNNKGKGKSQPKVNQELTESQANNKYRIRNNKKQITNNEKQITRESKDKAFDPPSLDDVLDYYFSKHGEAVSKETAQAFINYYAARGWKMGSAPMADWRPAFESWCKKEAKFNGNTNDGSDKNNSESSGEHGQASDPGTHDGSDGEGRSTKAAIW